MVFDDTFVLDETHMNKDDFDLFRDEFGNLINYPRTEIIKSTDKSVPDKFGETVDVKKKLELVTLKVKNTSETDIVSFLGSCFNLHVGENESIAYDYVYDRTPEKHTTRASIVYYDIGGVGKSYWRTELMAHEEKVCHVGFLVDEDMIHSAYMLFGSSPDYQYHLKLSE